MIIALTIGFIIILAAIVILALCMIYLIDENRKINDEMDDIRERHKVDERTRRLP